MCQVYVSHDGRSSQGLDEELTSQVNQLVGAVEGFIYSEFSGNLSKVEYHRGLGTMCSEEGRIRKALDETSFRDHQLLTRTPTNFCIDGNGEELHLQPTSLEAREYEG